MQWSQIDCDLQDPPSLILEFVEKWEAGFQVVYGIRKKRKEGWSITQLRALFYHLVNWLSEYPLPQQAGDFRLVARPIIEELKKMEEPYPYIRGMIAGMGFNQTGIPYDRQERKHDESKFNLPRLIGLAVDGILNTSIVPLRVATFTGISVWLLTCLGVLYYLIAGRSMAARNGPSGFATVIIAVLLSLGLNAFFLGIIGEYLGRVYNHVKKRPTVIIEQCIDSDGYVDLRQWHGAGNDRDRMPQLVPAVLRRRAEACSHAGLNAACSLGIHKFSAPFKKPPCIFVE